jgi:hypothetical protein
MRISQQGHSTHCGDRGSTDRSEHSNLSEKTLKYKRILRAIEGCFARYPAVRDGSRSGFAARLQVDCRPCMTIVMRKSVAAKQQAELTTSQPCRSTVIYNF